jgi:hypothetical protein
MKIRNILLFIPWLGLFCFIGCTTQTKSVPYSFTEGKTENGTATIIFVSSNNNRGIVRLIDYEGKEIPAPANGTHWEPITLPAGRPLTLRVYVGWAKDKYGADMPGYRRRGIFNCPALEAGKQYKLWFDTDTDTKNSNRDYYGTGYIVLTDVKVKKLTYLLKLRSAPLYKQEYVQKITKWP